MSAHDIDSNAGDTLAPAVPTRPVSTRRGWIPLLVLFCVGGLSAGVARSYLFSKPSVGPTGHDEIVESLAKPSLTPEDVVRLQVDSLRASTTNPKAIAICFSFASPSNRELTGPIDRFAQLVNTEPYRQIGVCREYQIGRAMIEGNTANVLVSILTQDGPGVAFQFLLSRQSDAPYQDCWMTDGVFPLLPLKAGQPGSAPPFENSLNSKEPNESESPADPAPPSEGEDDGL